MFLLALLGCVLGGADGTGTVAYDRCDTTLESVDRDDASLGFTATELLSFLVLNTATQLTWDIVTLGTGTASVELALGDVAGDVAIVRNAADVGACREEAALRVPLEMSANIADGGLVAAGILVFDASALSAQTIWPFSDGGGLSVDVAGSYATQLDEHVASSDHAGDSIVNTWLNAAGPWGATEISVEVDYAKTGREAVWGGHWVVNE